MRRSRAATCQARRVLLMRAVRAWTVVSSRAGSAASAPPSPNGIRTRTGARWLPSGGRSPSPVSTGISRLSSAGGRSPRTSRCRVTAIAQAVRNTSFTVTPAARARSVTHDSGTSAKRHRRGAPAGSSGGAGSVRLSRSRQTIPIPRHGLPARLGAARSPPGGDAPSPNTSRSSRTTFTPSWVACRTRTTTANSSSAYPVTREIRHGSRSGTGWGSRSASTSRRPSSPEPSDGTRCSTRRSTSGVRCGRQRGCRTRPDRPSPHRRPGVAPTRPAISARNSATLGGVPRTSSTAPTSACAPLRGRA